MKAQMKAANRSGAPVAIIVGDDEAAAGVVTVRSMRGDAIDADNRQRQVPRADLVTTVNEILEETQP